MICLSNYGLTHERMCEMQIAYDKEASTEMDAKYFVYEDNCVIYKGTWSQCLCVVGAFHLDPTTSLDEIRSRSNGFI